MRLVYEAYFRAVGLHVTELATFAGRGQVSIGAELSVAVGPVGRTGAGNVSVAAEGVAHAYSCE